MKSGVNKKSLSRIIEIVGPAGAGKTTLYRKLAKFEDSIRLKSFPYITKLENKPFYLWHGLHLALNLLQYRPGTSRQLTRREFAWMTVLTKWNTVLKKDLKRDKRVIVIDQGPVYLMAEILQTGPEYLRNPNDSALWQKIYSDWANTLDVIFWLDAQDQMLAERIRTREKDHLVKDGSDTEVITFLRDFRSTYENIFEKLSNCANAPSIVRLDTGQHSPDELAQRVLSEIGLKV
jgi:thymidylate kinase